MLFKTLRADFRSLRFGPSKEMLMRNDGAVVLGLQDSE